MPELPATLFQRWVHVREDDTAGTRTYRPAGHPLPPARGRDGIEFRADGTFVEWRSGPADAPIAGPAGRWTAQGEGRLRLHRSGRPDTVLAVVTVTEQLLQVRTLPA